MPELLANADLPQRRLLEQILDELREIKAELQARPLQEVREAKKDGLRSLNFYAHRFIDTIVVNSGRGAVFLFFLFLGKYINDLGGDPSFVEELLDKFGLG